jgi:transposase
MGDYSAKIVFIGIDVHKKTYSVTCIVNGNVVKRATMPADPRALVAFSQKFFPDFQINSAYEAGFSGFVLHRHLERYAWNNFVVHPASIETAARERVKNDKRDSKKIATQLSTGRLSSIYIPSEEREQYRTLTRLRESHVKERSRFGCRIKSLLYQFGLISHDQNWKMSKKRCLKFIELHIDGDLGFCLHELCSIWLLFDRRIKIVEQRMRMQAQKDYKIESVYHEFSGIGDISARVLANELEDLSQFSNERQLSSYLGLTPREHSSGEHTWLGHISHQGKPILRKILVQASWVAIKNDPELKAVHERISKNVGPKKAILGVARRLIGRVRARFRKGESYVKSK